jgi:uncharacterized RDD family membrane protein YckC
VSSTPPPPPPASPPPGGGGGATRPNASFGERAVALLIDFGILIALSVAVGIVVAIVGAVSDALGALVGFVGYALVLGVGIVMQVLGEGGPLGQTPGKHLRGIQVVKDDGSALSISDAVVRWLGRILDTIVCGLPIGYVWALFDDEDRTWHDLVASTRVKQGGPQGSLQGWLASFRG